MLITIQDGNSFCFSGFTKIKQYFYERYKFCHDKIFVLIYNAFFSVSVINENVFPSRHVYYKNIQSNYKSKVQKNIQYSIYYDNIILECSKPNLTIGLLEVNGTSWYINDFMMLACADGYTLRGEVMQH